MKLVTVQCRERHPGKLKRCVKMESWWCVPELGSNPETERKTEREGQDDRCKGAWDWVVQSVYFFQTLVPRCTWVTKWTVAFGNWVKWKQIMEGLKALCLSWNLGLKKVLTVIFVVLYSTLFQFFIQGLDPCKSLLNCLNNTLWIYKYLSTQYEIRLLHSLVPFRKMHILAFSKNNFMYRMYSVLTLAYKTANIVLYPESLSPLSAKLPLSTGISWVDWHSLAINTDGA